MSKIISIVGLVLIVAAGLLASVSTSKEDILKSKKALCAKYTASAEEALKNKEFDKAIKFAKEAIQVDPSNKSGYKVLEKIYTAQCSGTVPAATNNTNNSKAAKPAPKKDEEEELGC